MVETIVFVSTFNLNINEVIDVCLFLQIWKCYDLHRNFKLIVHANGNNVQIQYNTQDLKKYVHKLIGHLTQTRLL